MVSRRARAEAPERPNHHVYGSRSERGTTVAAMMHSLVETPKINGVDLELYLKLARYGFSAGAANSYSQGGSSSTFSSTMSLRPGLLIHVRWYTPLSFARRLTSLSFSAFDKPPTRIPWPEACL